MKLVLVKQYHYENGHVQCWLCTKWLYIFANNIAIISSPNWPNMKLVLVKQYHYENGHVQCWLCTKWLYIFANNIAITLLCWQSTFKWTSEFDFDPLKIMGFWGWFHFWISILATSKVISGRVMTCDNAHSWQHWKTRICLIRPAFEPVRLGFPDVPKMEMYALLIRPSSLVFKIMSFKRRLYLHSTGDLQRVHPAVSFIFTFHCQNQVTLQNTRHKSVHIGAICERERLAWFPATVKTLSLPQSMT